MSRITADESSRQGGLSPAVVGAYLAAMPSPVPGGAAGAAVWLAAGFVGAEGMRVATTVWLAAWTGGYV